MKLPTYGATRRQVKTFSRDDFDMTTRSDAHTMSCIRSWLPS